MYLPASPLVSVIVPVWNAEPYLQRCLSSILKQTLRDIEIICVNDASTDGSLKILEAAAASDTRVQIINLRENSGESAARNAALARARGSFIGSVDNDDDVDLNFFEELYTLAQKTGADIAKGTRLQYEPGRQPKIQDINSYVSKSKAYFTSQWWTAIYSRKLIENNSIDFPVGFPLNGDSLFLTKAVVCANGVAVTDAVRYHYHRRLNSGNSMILSETKVTSFIETSSMLLDYLNRNCGRLSDEEFDYMYCYNMIRLLSVVLREVAWAGQKAATIHMAAEAAIRGFGACGRKEALSYRLSLTLPAVCAALANANRTLLESQLAGYGGMRAFTAEILRNRLHWPASMKQNWKLLP